MATPGTGRLQGVRLVLEARGFAACSLCGTLTRAETHCGVSLAVKPTGYPNNGSVFSGIPMPVPGCTNAAVGQRVRTGKAPNKTEAEYKRLFIDPRLKTGEFTDCWFEGVAFKMHNNHRYTPDWTCMRPDGRFYCVEVKGSWRFGSHQRARLAFDQARIELPGVEWVWAVRGKGGEWQTADG